MGRMNQIELSVGLGAGCVGVAVYFVSCGFKKKAPSLGEVVDPFLAGTAIPAGLTVCKLAADAAVIQCLELDNRIFMFIGGFAVIWVSLANLIRLFK